MRIRPLISLSAIALTGVLLAGCTGTPGPSASPSPTADASLCDAAALAGSSSDAVAVEGEFGEESTATFSTPLEPDEMQRTVLSEGDGQQLQNGDWVQFAATAFDGATGEQQASIGYEDGSVLPSQISADSGLGQILGCATVGTRIVAAFPAGESSGAQVYIVDVLGVTPTAAWGEPQAPVDGMPTVTLAEDGTPSVTIPDADAPTELQISVLKEGDGPAVEAGDTTLLQYFGVNWATGETFDDSWSKGAPIFIEGNTYVEGFIQALDGQKVGSQVLVVIPPALAYGEEGESDHELAGQTLVFVIDILATQHAASE